MIKNLYKRLLMATLTVSCVQVLAASSPQLVAPPYNVSNRHDVNVATGQLSLTHPDVGIGGDMGLSHSISMHNGSWAGPDMDPSGPNDKFSGRLICVRRNAYTGDGRFWLIASDGNTTQFFDPGTGTTAAVPDANGNFPPLNDKRYSLRYEAAENGMVMTEPDGTKIIYGASAVYTNMTNFCSPYDMTEIRKPNGFTTKINLYTNGKPASVVTNTGFQLRYYFVPSAAGTDPNGWWGLNPAYVVGINNASQYCPHTSGSQLNGADCTVSGWPKVQYIWPSNMPTSMVNSGGTFSVINPNGVQIDYSQSYFIHNTSRATRLVGIKRLGSTDFIRQYSYLPWVEKGNVFGIAFYWPNELGVISSSWTGNDVITYSPYSVTAQGTYMSSGGYQTITSAYTNTAVDASGGKLQSVSSWDYSATFNADGTLNAYQDNLQVVGSTYAYDARGNVTGITSRGATQNAEYEATCTTTNYKYCNKPKWVRDGKGLNKTVFTYHQASGLPETVTSPANKNGKIAQTRYTYLQRTANYFQDATGVKKPGTAIWMLDTEKFCMNSNFSGTCAGNDEVTTTYEYNDNLLVKGIAVFSQIDNKTERTCFQYDKYGNQIGKTRPLANTALTSCN